MSAAALKTIAAPYPPAAEPPVAAMHADIDARLDRLRSELMTVMPAAAPAVAPRRPQSAGVKMPHEIRRVQPPMARDKKVLLYMPFFETAQIRAARLAATQKSPRNLGARGRPPSPGNRQVGYRIQSKDKSAPAVTMAKKIVLSANVDPLIPDDYIPGPGTYDLLKY